MITRFRVGGYSKLTVGELALLAPHVRQIPEPDNSLYFMFEGDAFAAKKALPEKEVTLEGVDIPATSFEVLLREIRALADRATAGPAFNERVSVSVAGLGLLSIRQVEVLYDCCTSELQKQLDKGWSILAVCPQPDQRRPDYIVGRAKHGEDE